MNTDKHGSERAAGSGQRAAKHTPGPWTVSEPDRNTFGDTISIVGGETGESVICEVLPLGDIPDCGLKECHEHVESAANARLIASAPELLAACKDMLKKIHRLYPLDWQGTKGNALAAIAKAEGAPCPQCMEPPATCECQTVE